MLRSVTPKRLHFLLYNTRIPCSSAKYILVDYIHIYIYIYSYCLIIPVFILSRLRSAPAKKLESLRNGRNQQKHNIYFTLFSLKGYLSQDWRIAKAFDRIASLDRTLAAGVTTVLYGRNPVMDCANYQFAETTNGRSRRAPMVKVHMPCMHCHAATCNIHQEFWPKNINKADLIKSPWLNVEFVIHQRYFCRKLPTK
jgi:hypothetical protein